VPIVHSFNHGSENHLPPSPLLQTPVQRRKIIRTPGGKLVFQYLKKRPSVPKCPMTGLRLKGIKPSRPAERKRLSLRQKKVFRAYGGVLSHMAVKEKIIRAFLLEEEKMVMKLKKSKALAAAGKE
ncbi:60S ribosomal protein L34, partial [Caligus rogercresseyi]